MARIDAFFKLMNDEGASDLHMVAGQQPVLRIRGDMERVKFKELQHEELKAMLYEICPEDRIKAFEESGDLDFCSFEKTEVNPHTTYIPKSCIIIYKRRISKNRDTTPALQFFKE